MRRSFPDAMVRGYENLAQNMTCDPKDRYVLEAAVRGNAEVLVTFNLKGFSEASTADFDISVVHLDDAPRADGVDGPGDEGAGQAVPRVNGQSCVIDEDRLAEPGVGIGRFAGRDDVDAEHGRVFGGLAFSPGDKRDPVEHRCCSLLRPWSRGLGGCEVTSTPKTRCQKTVQIRHLRISARLAGARRLPCVLSWSLMGYMAIHAVIQQERACDRCIRRV
jgi:hypothetical protein